MDMSMPWTHGLEHDMDRTGAFCGHEHAMDKSMPWTRACHGLEHDMDRGVPFT